MLIKKINIKNFRQFKETAEFDFSTSDNNVTLIIADNGAGKTTLAQAFLWCLYGETSFRSQNLLSNSVMRELGLNQRSTVSVSMEIEQNGVTYKIRRKEEHEKKNKTTKVVKQDFSVTYVGESGKTEFMTKVQSDIFVKKLLPKELSTFFFFSGEKIESMSKEIEGGKSKQFREAVDGLAGLTATLNAKKHFNPTSKESVYGQFQKEIDDSGNSTESSLINSIQALQIKIANNLNRLDEIEPEIEKYDEKIRDNKLKLEKLLEAEQLADEVKHIEKKINSNEESKKSNINSLLAQFSKYTVDLFTAPLLYTALKDLQDIGALDKGIPDMRDTTVKFLLERGYCICGESLEVGSEAYNNVYKLMDVLPPKNIGQLISEFVSSAKIKTKNADGYIDQINNLYKTIREIDNRNEQLEVEKGDLLELVTDVSEAEKLRNENRMLENANKKLEEERIDIKANNKNHEEAKKRLESEKNNLGQISKKNAKIMEYLSYAREVYNHFDRDYEERSKKTRTELEHRMNAFLARIFDGSISITIDDKYNIGTYVKDGEFLDSNNLEMDKSTAQGYAIIFAFISALVDMAKEKAKEDIENYNSAMENGLNGEDLEFQDAFPLVMDAPLSVFDKKRIKHLSELLPAIADQVVFFIKDTDGEVAEEYLGAKIGAKYILHKDKYESLTTVERII